MSQNRYELEKASATDSCVETRKNLKARLKIEKMKMKDFIELSRNMDIPWEARYQTVGQQYLHILEIKRQLEKAKNVKK